MIAALWRLMVLSRLLLFVSGAKLPFFFQGGGMDVLAVDACLASGGSNTYNVSLLLRNGPEEIVNEVNGYLTTMRLKFWSSGDAVTKGTPFCDNVVGGCPVPANETFTMNFSAKLGTSVHKFVISLMTADFAAGDRFIGTLRIQFTPALTRALELGLGIAIPLGVLLVSAAKYCLVVLLDPEPVSSWKPLLSRQASGANELATIASIRDVITFLQFTALVLLVNVQYPVYFQALTSRIAWLLGIFSNSWVSKHHPLQVEQDGIIVPAGSTQLESVLYFAELPSIADWWPCVAVSLLTGLAVVGLCGLVSYWKSSYRCYLVISALLHYWFALFSLPVLIAIISTFKYMQMYNPDGVHDLPQRPFSFGLVPPFYKVNTNPGIIFSMAFVLGLWLCLAAYTVFSMARARYKGYLSFRDVIVWGRFYRASHNDVFYHIHHLVVTVLLACTFSILSHHGLAQCIILLATQLASLSTVSGTRPRGLTTVGYVLIMIPKTLQIVVCCLLFALLPEVLQQHPKMMADHVPDRVVYAIVAIHLFVLLYFILVAAVCVGITTWRHFYLRPVCAEPEVEFKSQEDTLPNHIYYRKPQNQPVDEDASREEEELIRKNYAIREVDFVYGINGASNFIDKMFKPALPAQASAIDLSRLNQHPQPSTRHDHRIPASRRWWRRNASPSPRGQTGFEVLRP